MVFESLYESAKKDELLLVENGLCRFHVRKDGQLTIYELITTKKNVGIGLSLLNQIKQISGIKFIIAKCPADLNANKWYEAVGFYLNSTEKSKKGRSINVWKMDLI